MKTGIYRITFNGSSREYIGSAHNTHRRKLEHLSMLRRDAHANVIMQRCFNKYGEESFTFKVIETCTKDDLLDREQCYIDGLTKSERMNICLVAGNTAGRKHSDETKQLIREKAIGREVPPRSNEYREKISARFKGKPKSPEHMEALQKGRAARVYTDEQREAVSKKLKELYRDGKISRAKTEDHKNKIGQFYAKLTDDEVREIRKLKAEGHTCKSIALQYGSNAATISRICTGKQYRWVN